MGEPKEHGIGTVPIISEAKPLKEALPQQKLSPAPVNDSPKQFSTGHSGSGVAYAPAAIPPRPLSAASRASIPQAKKEQTVFRAKAQAPMSLQKSAPVHVEAIPSPPVDGEILQKKKDGHSKVDWID